MATIADYWVGKTIGEGSFGVVRHCRLKSTDLDVAIKCIDKQSMKNPLAVVQEQKLLKLTKKSEYTVDLFASFHDKDCVYLVTECCTGGTLAGLCDSPMKIDSVAHFGLQLLDGVSFLHGSAGILHCDLKPQNILLTSAGHLKIADFGCAVSMKQPSDATAPPRGTTAYSSPELVKGVFPLTVATDLWSFGTIMATLVFGSSPFACANEMLTVKAISEYCKNRTEDVVFFKDQPITQEWKNLIWLLLDPVAEDRLGVCDKTNEKVEEMYPSIRKAKAWTDADMYKKTDYQSDPIWLKEANESGMKDGKEGGCAFLM